MYIIKTKTDYGVFAREETALVSSREVAKYFEKRHDNVLRDIQNMKCSEEFRLLNFEESSYKNEQGKKQPEYLMTRDGFTILVMGFTGEKAMDMKEKYIYEFNYMVYLINERLVGKAELSEMTDAVKNAHDPCMSYHYSNEADMINRIVTGMSSKQFKEKFNIQGNSIRPYLNALQLHITNILQRFNAVYIEEGLDFQTRKALLTKRAEKIFLNPPKRLLNFQKFLPLGKSA